jgi:Fur family ferric uptake transcriptional regulator
MKSAPDRSASDPDAVLRAAGLRRTPVRLGVIEVLAAAGRPLSAQQILDRLPGHADGVTVYRTLNTFTSKRLLHRVRGEEEAWLYAFEAPPASAAKAAHNHAHFVCDGCGTVECLKDTPLPRSMTRGLNVASGYDVTYSELLLHGTCPRCHK